MEKVMKFEKQNRYFFPTQFSPIRYYYRTEVFNKSFMRLLNVDCKFKEAKI